MIKRIEYRKENTNKNWLKKTWDFLWNSNSVLSWIIDFILIFLLVKFIIFPGVGLLLGTSLPLVIIESGSMEHQGNFDFWFSLHGQWYVDQNISKETISNWSWNNGLDKGDIMVVQGNKNQNYDIGDVIIFNVPNQQTPIIHRVINKTESYYVTKGDHNDGQLAYEHTVLNEQIIGKAISRIPKLGWVKLFFYKTVFGID